MFKRLNTSFYKLRVRISLRKAYTDKIVVNKSDKRMKIIFDKVAAT